MSYSSKRTLVSMIAGTILIAAYSIYAFGKYAPAPEDLKSWAVSMLVFIWIGVAAVIVILILFHVAFAIGLAAREHAQGRAPVVAALHIPFGSLAVGSLAEGIVSVYYYERGIRNG